MPSKLVPPVFATDDEESEWWYAHRDEVSAEIDQAFAEGRVRRYVPTPPSSRNTPTTSIRLDPADIAKARIAAEKRGLRYQTYLKMLIHEALEKESAA
jgi:hypothetical protein